VEWSEVSHQATGWHAGEARRGRDRDRGRRGGGEAEFGLALARTALTHHTRHATCVLFLRSHFSSGAGRGPATQWANGTRHTARGMPPCPCPALLVAPSQLLLPFLHSGPCTQSCSSHSLLHGRSSRHCSTFCEHDSPHLTSPHLHTNLDTFVAQIPSQALNPTDNYSKTQLQSNPEHNSKTPAVRGCPQCYIRRSVMMLIFPLARTSS
jgi:hypothetical protein